jgi:hypothetical protein
VTSRLEAAFALIDAANADDPNTIAVGGVERPKELVHAEMMTEWVRRLDPGADDAQLLAARAHHLRRWTIPRQSYPEGRAGYLRWRKRLKDQQAEEVVALLAPAGYEPPEIERVQAIIRKEGLGRDPHVQVHEDALCLVFLETQALQLAGELGEQKTIDVLQKTMRKMSPAGIDAALALDVHPAVRDLVVRAASS